MGFNWTALLVGHDTSANTYEFRKTLVIVMCCSIHNRLSNGVSIGCICAVYTLL